MKTEFSVCMNNAISKYEMGQKDGWDEQLYNNELTLIFGERAITSLQERKQLEYQIDKLTQENQLLLQKANTAFSVNLSLTDVIVAAATGVLCGALNSAFKTFVPQHGDLKHKHSTTRTAVDYKVPKPEGMKGSVQGLHRQIGPGHDIARWNEALDLMSGKTNDFPLWGKTIAERTGGVLHAGNVRVDDFIAKGGFKIPDDPKKELMNHLLIDFFTKTSLPLPFSSYIADSSELLAKMMIGMYDEGLNLKNAVGNVSATVIIQMVMHAYVYLFKAIQEADFFEKVKQIKNADEAMLLFDRVNSANKKYVDSNEFHVLQMIAHSASFLVDASIITASQNYTGILSLDYASLLVLANHSVKYVSRGVRDYKEAIAEMKEINASIEMANREWLQAFKNEVMLLANFENFNEAFSPRLMLEYHENVMSTFGESDKKKAGLRAELEEWEVDEDI